MGSKRRIAKYILPIMLEHRNPDQWWVEPFVGGGNMIDKVDGLRLGSDANKWAIQALLSIRDHADELPKNNREFTEEDYNKLKDEAIKSIGEEKKVSKKELKALEDLRMIRYKISQIKSLKQIELAKWMGVTPKTIQMWALNKPITLVSLEKEGFEVEERSEYDNTMANDQEIFSEPIEKEAEGTIIHTNTHYSTDKQLIAVDK